MTDVGPSSSASAQSYALSEEDRKKVIRNKLQQYFGDKIKFTEVAANDFTILFSHFGPEGKKRDMKLCGGVTADNAAKVINKLGAMLILVQNVPLINDNLFNWYIDLDPQKPNFLELDLKLNALSRVTEKIYIDFGPKGESCCRTNQDGSFVFDCNPIVTQIQATTARLYGEEMRRRQGAPAAASLEAAAAATAAATSKEAASKPQTNNPSSMDEDDDLVAALSNLRVSAKVMADVSIQGVLKPGDLTHS